MEKSLTTEEITLYLKICEKLGFTVSIENHLILQKLIQTEKVTIEEIMQYLKISEKAGFTVASEDHLVLQKIIKNDNEHLRNVRLCRICLDKEANRLTLPCAHLCCCEICISAVVTCWICKEKIKGVITVYFG